MKRKGEHLPLRDAKKPRLDFGVENRLISEYYLPPEIIEHILGFVEEDQKSNLRLVSPSWHSIIKKSYFRIGCILPEEIEDIVANFNRYTRLIGLRFDKTYKLSADDVGPLFTLTNLSSLEIYPIQSDYLPGSPFNYFFDLPATNLEQLAISQVDILHEGCLTNLTKLHTNRCNSFSRMSQLVSLQATSIPLSFALTHNLTYLATNTDVAQLLPLYPSLKTFKSGTEYITAAMDFSKNTNLDSIEVKVNAIRNVPPSVTSLTVPNFKPNMLQQSSSLRRLVTHSGNVLPGLTRMEYLEVKTPIVLGGTQQLKEMPVLKELSIHLLDPSQVSCLQDLHSLESLNVHYEFYYEPGNVEPLMSLTRLTALQISSYTKVFGLDGISKLKNLQKFGQCARLAEDIHASHLYALRRLTSLTWKSPMKFYTANMTQLRELQLSSEGNQVASFNLPLVTSLAIAVDNTNYFWRCVSTLSSLRELTLYNLTDGTRLLHLTSLRHLTLLRSLNNRCQGYTITALTRLQHFMFAPPCNWSESFKREVQAKLPHLKDFHMSISSKVD
jgi:hypothetical protein